MGSSPEVAVIIPTVGRSELARAVRSAANQRSVQVEIIVVVDAIDGSVEIAPEVHSLAHQVLWTGGGRRAAAARNMGVRASTAPWVSFLDDDDEWMSGKLVAQLRLASDEVEPHVLVSSRHVQFLAEEDGESKPLPVRLKRDDESVAAYLFHKRRPAGGRASMYTSTLMCDRELAILVPWDESLRRHQDWDWLVQVDARGDTGFVQAHDALTRIQSGSVGSISAGTSWQDSLEWAQRVLRPSVPAEVLVDFLAGQSLRYAISARSMAGVQAVLAEIRRARRIPSAGPLAIALGGLLPRRLVERIMVVVR